jgi:glycosyltransferase XagB
MSTSPGNDPSKNLVKTDTEKKSIVPIWPAKVVVVLPTYNEIENISDITTQILAQQTHLDEKFGKSKVDLKILVVDDNSPDGTGKFVEGIAQTEQRIKLLSGNKQGLGIAYIRGFRYAMDELGADVVMEMDADFSHNPRDITKLIEKLYPTKKEKETMQKSDFVIGSRYVRGGSVPENWGRIRKLNSKWGNVFASRLGGIQNVRDCTSGFRAIRTNLIKKIHLEELVAKGYGFQIDLLHKCQMEKARIAEIPIQFIDRVKGESKISIKDVREFVSLCASLRFPALRYFNLLFLAGSVTLVVAIIISQLALGIINGTQLLILFISTLSVVMLFQGVFSLWCSLYAWESPDRMKGHKSPEVFTTPQLSFTALLPARHEPQVIGDTIRSVAGIDYPEHLKETIIICRTDDTETIKKAQETIDSLKEEGKENVKLVTFSDFPINKPHGLNVGLRHANNEVVCIFDAEDTPHHDIYHIVNTEMVIGKADVVQSGIQLMNYNSRWFSTLNVLEYYFWFRSALHFFSKAGLITLGGNTVFFKRKWLNYINGWDETCLTEDAEVGIKLSMAGARIKVLYDPMHATQEETPPTLTDFIKQRTRWNQGFIQVLMKGEWLKLREFSQQLLAIYLLFWPIAQAILFLFIPVSIYLAFTIKTSIWITMLTILPIYMLILQLVVSIIGFYEFAHDYKIKFPTWFPFAIIVSFIPYQILIGIGAYRSIIRLIKGSTSWEKTAHINAHRKEVDQSIKPKTQSVN